MNGKTWQQAASFRGKPFFVATDGREGGRRIVHHEFPNRDKGYGEDLGQLDDTFALECYTTERSPGGYAAARDAVIEAAKQRGPGKLVHPYYGERDLLCISYAVQHDKAENGVARFTLTFLDAAAESSPAASQDLKSQAVEAADSGVAVTLQDFAVKLSEVPGYVREAAQSVLADVGQVMDAAFPFVNDALDTMSGTSAMLRSGLELAGEGSRFFQGAVNLPVLFSRLAGGLGGNLANVAGLGNQVAGLARLLTPASGSWGRAYSTQRQLWSYGESLPQVPQHTANRKVQAANQAAIVALVQRASLFEAARCVPFMELESRSQAVEVREELTQRLDREAEQTRNNDLYRALEGMRRVVVDDLNRRAPSLALLSSYVPAATSPALVVSYELYGTPHRAAEIVTRNAVPHPGRLPGGQPLEVLRT